MASERPAESTRVRQLDPSSSFDSRVCSSSLHIAVTQLHTQPGVVETLLRDTEECVAEILKSGDKNDTPTVGNQNKGICSPMHFLVRFRR